MHSFIQFNSAGDVTVKAGHRLDSRIIPDYEIVYFPKGSRSVYTTQGCDYSLHEACVVMTRPGEAHEYRFDPDEPTRHLFIHFNLVSEAVLPRYPRLFGGEYEVMSLSDSAIVSIAMKQMMFQFYERRCRWRQMSEMLLLSVFEELESRLTNLEESARKDRIIPDQVVNALQYIEDHVREPIEVESLAQRACWSHEHFTRMFHRHVGLSPKEWMTKRKIEIAAQLLLQSSDSVKQIARCLGFADEYYFYRLFRKTNGMTAAEYRRRYSDPRMRVLESPEDGAHFYPLNHYFWMPSEDEG